MFLGFHPGRLNPSHQLALPQAWRHVITGGFYITQGFDRNLLLLPAPAFHEMARQIAALNLADPNARLFSRMLLGRATIAEIDRKGRITLPEELVKYAGLDQEMVIVGQGNYAEIWSNAEWQDQLAAIENPQANASRFTSLIIAVN